MKNTPENKDRIFELATQLMATHGTGREISNFIYEAEYSYVGYICVSQCCVDESHFEVVQVMRGLREFLLKIDELDNKL